MIITNTAKVSIFGGIINVIYESNDIGFDEYKFIELINQRLNWVARNEGEIKKRASQKLLPLKNETWLEENEGQLSRSEFMNRIKLTSISFYGKGNSEMIFDDGDLFWGHEIVADLDIENKLNDITIRG